MGLPETNPGAQASASVLLTPFDLDQAPTSARRGFSFGASASAGALTFLFRKVARAVLETVCYKPATMRLLKNDMHCT
jgi:hypothetical protein